jgi:hypothetical protein
MALFTTALGLYGGVLWSGELQGFILHEVMPTMCHVHVSHVKCGWWPVAVASSRAGRLSQHPVAQPAANCTPHACSAQRTAHYSSPQHTHHAQRTAHSTQHTAGGLYPIPRGARWTPPRSQVPSDVIKRAHATRLSRPLGQRWVLSTPIPSGHPAAGWCGRIVSVLPLLLCTRPARSRPSVGVQSPPPAPR